MPLCRGRSYAASCLAARVGSRIAGGGRGITVVAGPRSEIGEEGQEIVGRVVPARRCSWRGGPVRGLLVQLHVSVQGGPGAERGGMAHPQGDGGGGGGGVGEG